MKCYESKNYIEKVPEIVEVIREKIVALDHYREEPVIVTQMVEKLVEVKVDVIKVVEVEKIVEKIVYRDRIKEVERIVTQTVPLIH